LLLYIFFVSKSGRIAKKPIKATGIPKEVLKYIGSMRKRMAKEVYDLFAWLFEPKFTADT
jgi:hypothetical protein